MQTIISALAPKRTPRGFSAAATGLGIAALLAFGTASPAAAATLTVNSAGAYNLGSVQLDGTIAGYGPFSRGEVGGPVVLQGTTSSGKPFSVITYCFDLLHNISVGFGYQASVNYTFSTAPMSTDNITGPGTGNILTLSQVQKMSGLAKLGARLFLNGSPNLNDAMPAIQAAIWNSEYGLTATLANPSAQALYEHYRGLSFTGATVPGLVARNAQGLIIGAQQSLALAHGAVPEPASWALLITGFGAVGVAARRRRAGRAVTA